MLAALIGAVLLTILCSRTSKLNSIGLLLGLQPRTSSECWLELPQAFMCGPHTGVEAPGISTVHLTDHGRHGWLSV